MKIGYTGWTWDVDEHRDFAPVNEFHRENFTQFLRDISDLGYETAEHFCHIADAFNFDARLFRQTMDAYGVEFANLYFFCTGDARADAEGVKRYIAFAQAVGATHMNLQAVMWKERPLHRPTDSEKVLIYADLANVIGGLCAQVGIKACMHPHANTNVFTGEQIDLFLANTDPRRVSLCLDTAHIVLAGMDAVKAVHKYGKRIGYVHLKDLNPNPDACSEWPMRRFLPLGYGEIDFKAVVDALRTEGYDGILCVETDYQPVCNYKSAMDSRQYIRRVLHL